VQVGRLRGRGYAAPAPRALAGVASLAVVACLAACGSERVAMVSASVTPAPGITAPRAEGTGTEPPSFGVVMPTSTGGPTLEVTVPAMDPSATHPTPRATVTVTRAAPPAPVATAAAAPSVPASGLRIVPAFIPFPASRQAEMAAYSLRHSGSDTAALSPTVIVLHYTAGGTWSSTRDTFAADVRNLGELPNVCAHYVVDQDGTVYQLVPTTVRCRHTIGLNDVAIGIEMVQAAGSGPTWADQQILGRPAQVGAALALVRILQAQYGIRTSNVIGHSMANAAPEFHDLLGWRNDHADWQAADVAVFRSRL
jgi:hypothetical protein